MSDQFVYATEEARQAREAVNCATNHGHKALDEALAAAERTFSAATKATERVLKDRIDALRAQTSSYTHEAGRQFAEGQRYVVENVRQRPLTATLAGLGLGLLFGLMLSNRPR